jgi:hypothetical protein
MDYHSWLEKQGKSSKCIMVIAEDEEMPFIRAGSVTGQLKVFQEERFRNEWPDRADPTIKIWVSRAVDRETLPSLSQNEVTYELTGTATPIPR